MWYTYDGNGQLTSVDYGGTTYLYKVNQFGDVLGLYNTSGTLVVKYLYDPWGKLVRVTDQRGNTVTDAESIALRNPFRYRGYYYDTDTGWYYLNSRYYDPETGRFINADGYASTGQGFVGCNMFAYCENNPVNRADPSGRLWKEIVSAVVAGFKAIAPGYAGLGALALADGPLPVLDTIALVGAVVLTAGVIAYGVGAGIHTAANAGTSIPKSKSKSKSQEKDVTITPPKIPDKQAYFPANPLDFNPEGLTRKIYIQPGSGSNGGIIKWELPGTTSAIFEWNEDYNHGAHYHTLMVEWDNTHNGTHYFAGDAVPEPWNSMYFGG